MFNAYGGWVLLKMTIIYFFHLRGGEASQQRLVIFRKPFSGSFKQF